MTDGMLSLSWNNHKATFCHILSTLREKERYTDVTVACEGRFYPVHKLVLSTCSEYFEKIFENTPCKHPVIVLKDIASDELEALLSYMYDGVVSVAQNDLARLIKAAEVLRIKGLAVPDEPPPSKNDVSTRKASQSRNSSDDRSSPHPKRRRREENVSSQSTAQISPPASPAIASPVHIDTEPTRTQADTRWADHSEEQNTDRPLDDRLRNPASTTSSTPPPNVEVMVDETLVKEEIDDPTDNREDMLDSGMDYGSLGSDSRLDGSLGGDGEDGQMLPNKFEQKVGSQAQNQQLPESVVEALAGPSGMQGWLGGCEVPGGFSGMEGYSGEGSQDVHPPQQGPPGSAVQSQAHQMVGPNIDARTDGTAAHVVWMNEVPKRKMHHCPYCSYSTSYSTGLRRHILVHTGEKPFGCQFCPHRFRQKVALRNHTISYHSDKMV